MRPDEPDINRLEAVADEGDQSIFIATQIKDGAAIFEDVGLTKISFHIDRAGPLSTAYHADPRLDDLLRR